MRQNPIRVLHVIGRMKRAGAETLLMNIYRNIDRNKIQFDFIVHDNGEYDEEILKLGGKIYRIKPLSKVGEMRYKKQIEKILENGKYLIVHSHINETSGAILQVAKKCKVPVRISHAHSTGNNSNLLYKIYKIYLKKKIPKYATDFFACSNQAAKWLFGKKAKKAVIVNNGIDTKKFEFDKTKRKEKRNEFGIDNETIVIGNIGRLTKTKNQEFLIDIFKELKNKKVNSKLMIVGEGKYYDELIKRVKKYKLEEDIIFTGSRNDVQDIINVFDVFVFPSQYEGLGIVLIEAQCNGMQCFASDTVPKTAKVTENLHYISLKNNAKYWTEKIIEEYNACPKRDINAINEVRKNGYDIKLTTKFLEDFYEKKSSNE